MRSHDFIHIHLTRERYHGAYPRSQLLYPTKMHSSLKREGIHGVILQASILPSPNTIHSAE